jgi:hypothetical protein
MFQAVLDGAHEFLAHDRSHGAAEKAELERAGHDPSPARVPDITIRASRSPVCFCAWTMRSL